jgi:hypothetical protein
MTCITLNGYEETALAQALTDSIHMWEQRIGEAHAGQRPSMSIEGAMLLIEDLLEIRQKIKDAR